MILTIKQTRALDTLEDKRTNELLFGGGAGGAKSFIGCYWQLKSRLKYPGTRGLIGRSKLKSLKETTLNTFFDVAKIQGVSNTFFYNAQSGQIKFNNGSEIILKDLYSYPSDPNFDSLGSLEITDAFIDECNQISEKAKNIVNSRIRYKLNNYGLIPKLLMTCNPAKNWVYQEFYKPKKEGTLQAHREFIQALVTDNPYISPFYIENLKRLDKTSKERLLYGNWEYDSDPSALITYDSITNLFFNEFVSEGEKFITADIARFGSDSTVILVWSGFKVIRIEKKNKLSITESSNLIKSLMNEYSIPVSRVIVDEDGVGGGVKDILKCKGFVNNSKAIPQKGRPDNYDNLKSQCYFKLAEKINKEEIYFQPENIELKKLLSEELEQVKRKDVDKDGKLGIVPKDKVKEILGRSPDISDALMMRMYFELAPKREFFVV